MKVSFETLVLNPIANIDRNEWEENGWIDWNPASSSSWQADNENEIMKVNGMI